MAFTVVNQPNELCWNTRSSEPAISNWKSWNWSTAVPVTGTTDEKVCPL